MDHRYVYAPGAPIRSGIPEHGRIPKYYAVKDRLSLLVDELGEGELLPTERDVALRTGPSIRWTSEAVEPSLD